MQISSRLPNLDTLGIFSDVNNGSIHNKSSLYQGKDRQINRNNVRDCCSDCGRLFRVNARKLHCFDCKAFLHFKCSGIRDSVYQKLTRDGGNFYCPNCSAPCADCMEPVLNVHRGIQCDKCDFWFHAGCVNLDDNLYFFGPPFRPKKNFRPPPFFAMKITGQPHRKACKLNFQWKNCGNFFQAPPYKGQKFSGPPFLHQSPPYKCL